MTVGFMRDQFHPTRAAKNWPSYSATAARHVRGWGQLPTMEQLQSLLDALIPLYNSEIMKVSFDDRPRGNSVMMAHGELAVRLGGLHSDGFSVFSIEPAVRDMLKKTSLAGVRLGDLKPLFPRFYIGFEGGTGIFFGAEDRESAWEVDGAYVDLRSVDPTDGRIRVEVCLTTKDRLSALKPGYFEHWPLQWEPHYTLNMMGADDQTFAEALGFAIDSGEITLELDVDRDDAFRAGIVDTQPEAMAHGIELVAPERLGYERSADFNRRNLGPARECLALVLGVLCALSDKSGMMEHHENVWPSDTPTHSLDTLHTAKTPKARRNAAANLKRQGFSSVRRIVLGEDVLRRAARGGADHNTSGRSAHWRAGHFRRQRHGSGLELVKIIWIMPQFIGTAGDDEPGGRLYKVVKGTGRG